MNNKSENMKKNSVIRRVLRFIGVVLGTILFLWFLLPFLVAGILNIGNVTGIVVSAVFVIYMAFLPLIHEWIVQLWMKRKMKWVLGGCAAVISAIALLAAIETGCMINACMKAPAENATAVVLGCRVYGERASLSLVERLEAAYTYLEEHPEAACVVSGGQGPGEDISEAECMYRWLVAKGIDETRIYKEEKSTSTEENIAFSKAVIEENGLNEKIAIVTSEYHSYRAGVIAEKYELDYGTASGQTAIWLLPTFYIRELYAILAEWIF
ncbi:MAG: YdcF family protein [Agathobacter sp.]|nr:YdcF family protein [Agathobacter sp.]